MNYLLSVAFSFEYGGPKLALKLILRVTFSCAVKVRLTFVLEFRFY